MEKFTLTINTENASLADNSDFAYFLYFEARAIKNRILDNFTSGKILDDNGNTVGNWEWK